jgi:Fe-S cluster assembly iron-binding protein IscA
MFTVTNKAAELLKTAKSTKGIPDQTGIRIKRSVVPPASNGQPGAVGVGLAFTDGPEAGDAEMEQDGLRIFIEADLTEPLDGRTLDARDDGNGAELVLL